MKSRSRSLGLEALFWNVSVSSRSRENRGRSQSRSWTAIIWPFRICGLQNKNSRPPPILRAWILSTITWIILCDIVFVALECPPLVLPPGVSVIECPRRPVYGDVCIFCCADGTSEQASVRRVRSCEVKNYNTVYWTGKFPQCAGL